MVKVESIERIYEKIVLLNNVNSCKDHRDKTEVPDPLVVEDLISYKLNNRRKISKADFTV